MTDGSALTLLSIYSFRVQLQMLLGDPACSRVFLVSIVWVFLGISLRREREFVCVSREPGARSLGAPGAGGPASLRRTGADWAPGGGT